MNETNPTPVDFWYAVNNTEVVLKPRRHLETFGNTLLNYALISELMDSVGQVRIRLGRMQAARPQIITPDNYSSMILDGFGDEAEQYVEWLRKNAAHIHILRYGYTLKQKSFSEEIVTDSLDSVVERVKNSVEKRDDPFNAVIKGVDTPWDVCLVRFFMQMIEESAGPNVRELAQRRFFEYQDGIPVGLRDEIDRAFAAARANPGLIRPLGKKLQEQGLFEHYQDRFFELVKTSGSQ